jgi:hypothetical protein
MLKQTRRTQPQPMAQKRLNSRADKFVRVRCVCVHDTACACYDPLANGTLHEVCLFVVCTTIALSLQTHFTKCVCSLCAPARNALPRWIQAHIIPRRHCQRRVPEWTAGVNHSAPQPRSAHSVSATHSPFPIPHHLLMLSSVPPSAMSCFRLLSLPRSRVQPP